MSFKDHLKESVLHTLPIVAAFFAPAIYIAILIFIITLVDTWLGVRASKFLGKQITTNRFSDLFAKLIGYGIFLTVGLLINKITGWQYGVWLTGIVPLYTEIKSIDENQKTLGKKGIISQAEEIYKVVVKIKKKRDDLR